MFSETTCFGDRFKLPVDVLSITVLANADTAYDYHVVLRINSINDAVVAELMLPIADQRAAQRQSRSLRINGELLLQNLSQLLTDTAVESFDVRCGVRRVPKLKGRLSVRLLE